MSMARACRVIGFLLCILGFILAVMFVATMVMDQEYTRAAMARDRNPGNVLYDAEYKGALVKRAFESIGIIVGVLLVINGATLFGLGTLAHRVPRRKQLTDAHLKEIPRG
ncbi:MAG TPA: hypothetical protein VMT89_17280 [Candidatus Acidoferrales bacterium]|nr:hypothetical protein [Candidatus Acidoferrales bacterium]